MSAILVTAQETFATRCMSTPIGHLPLQRNALSRLARAVLAGFKVGASVRLMACPDVVEMGVELISSVEIQHTDPAF